MSRIEKALEKAAITRSEGVPAAIKAGPPKERTARKAPSQELPSAFPAVNQPIQLENRNLFTLLDTKSLASEEYRKLKSSIIESTRFESEFLNTIMVTSAIAGEGKSLTALNLALSLAQDLDHTVLLVDADFRRPTIHTYLGIENSRGFADCLRDNVDPSEVLVHTGLGKLVVLTAGSDVANPVELFSSQKAREFILELKDRYSDRYVIIDTPPLLPFAESRMLSNQVDAVLLVVREKLAAQSEIIETIEALKVTKLLGIVYNDASFAEIDKRHFKYYRGNYVRP